MLPVQLQLEPNFQIILEAFLNEDLCFCQICLHCLFLRPNISIKMLQKIVGFCFVDFFSLVKKIKYFYSWKIAELPERKRKDVDELRTSVRSMFLRRKCWIRLSEDHKIMLCKQLRTCILPDVKTNWPRTENSFPPFQQIPLLPFLIFKLYIPFHCFLKSFLKTSNSKEQKYYKNLL